MLRFDTLPPQSEGYASYFAAMQLTKSAESPQPGELAQLPALQCLKSLDDLDEEPDNDVDDEDLDEDDEDEDEEDDDEDLDDDYDEDEDEDDEDEDEDEDEEEEDDVKPLKMDGLSAPGRW